MTIAKETAKLAAQKIIEVISSSGGEPPHIVALQVIEALQGIPGNKSYQDSLQLMHREIKEIAIKTKRGQR